MLEKSPSSSNFAFFNCLVWSGDNGLTYVRHRRENNDALFVLSALVTKPFTFEPSSANEHSKPHTHPRCSRSSLYSIATLSCTSSAMARSTFKTVSNIASSSAPTIGRASTSRVTRSQSRDLGNSDHAILGRPKVTRSSRHTSVESAGSAFSKPVRRRKATRAIDIDTGELLLRNIP